MIQVSFELDQPIYEGTEDVIKYILKHGFHTYKSFDPDSVHINELKREPDYVTIILNGAKKKVRYKNHYYISYSEIVRLAGFKNIIPGVICDISYRYANKTGGGLLSKKQSVYLKEGMIINATFTSKA